MLSDHDRVDYQRAFDMKRSYGLDNFLIPERTEFGGVWGNVFQNCLDLRQHQIAGERVDTSDAKRVLDGDQSDDGFAVHAELMEGFEVGLHAGSATGVGAGDG